MQEQKEKSLWERLNPDEQNRMIIIWLVMIAVIMGFVTSFQDGSFNWRGIGGNLSTELIGAVFTFIVFERIIEKRDEQKYRKQLIKDMGSTVNDFALKAVEELRVRGMLTDGSLQGINLQGANLENADLTGANLVMANLEEANLQNTKLSGFTHLEKANLRSVNLQGAKMDFVILADADLTGANLQNTRLQDVIFKDAILAYANLQRAFINTEIQDAILYETDFRYAEITGGKQPNIDFEDCDLQGASFSCVNLTGGNFVGVNLENVTFDKMTILPDGSHWTPETDMERFTNPEHPDFWEPEWIKQS